MKIPLMLCEASLSSSGWDLVPPMPGQESFENHSFASPWLIKLNFMERLLCSTGVVHN